MVITLIAPPLMDYVSGQLMPISMDALRTCPPYGIYLLATILRRQGHQVAIIDLIAQGSKEITPYWPIIMNSHLIGIGTSSLSWPTARDCITEIRRMNPYVPIVLGGIHATMFDKYLLATTETNFVIRGEAEAALPQLCWALQMGGDLRTIPNLTFKRNSKIIQNTMAPKLTERELAQYPAPDYSALPAGVYSGLSIESSRGCPFDCAFCSTSHRRSWRGIETRRFVDKVEQILPYTALTTGGLIQIIDDEFSLKTERGIAIANEFTRRGLAVKIVFDSRANDLLHEEFLEATAPYACQFLVGAECGYNEGLAKVGKGTTTEKLEQAAALLQKYHMAEKADFSFILGLPWETKVEVMKTIDFARHLYTSYGVRVLLQWYCQIPGSQLWDEQKQKEVLHEAHYDDYGFFRNNYLFRTGINLPPSEIHEVYGYINSIKEGVKKNHYGMEMIDTSIPYPILQLYPVIPGLVMEKS
jgi:radical SAM superfamily enzyme YgiQ (UPF0313 family)